MKLYEDITRIKEIMGVDSEVENFSPSEFACYVKNSGIRFPEIAIAQAILETGHFESEIFKANNNCFGMKYAKIRPKTATGEYRGHARYDNWKQSVEDYKLWQDSRKIESIGGEQDYYKLLDRVYCPKPQCKAGTYSVKVKSLISQAKDLMNSCNQ